MAKWELGQLSTCFRLPIGACAIFVGVLTDRCGTRPMLLAYCFGCALASLLVAWAPDFRSLVLAMVMLGVFDSIYHPTGLAYLSQEISAESRTYALGIHGVFGSLGIAFSPFLASGLLASGLSWRGYYELLAITGFALGVVVMLGVKRRFHPPSAVVPSPPDNLPSRSHTDESPSQDVPKTDKEPSSRESANQLGEPQTSWWLGYFTVTVISSLLGFIYAAFLSFLPRYLDVGRLPLDFYELPAASVRNLLAGGVLSMGMLGQFWSGRVARPHRLEPHLALVLGLQAPLLVLMAFAEGSTRIYVAAAFALVHFMAQPVHNSLIASYTSRRHRSTCFGFSFMMGFGVGSSGAMFAGASGSTITMIGYYLVLAGLAVLASVLALSLSIATKRRRELWT